MKQFITTFSLVLALASAAFAQRTVVGTVTGDDGEALVGASVAVKGAAAGARTDLNGKFSVQVPTGSDVLVFTYTGYTTQELTLGATNVLDVVLASGLQLEEAVVTALGITRYKNELPYSAQKVDGDDVTRTRDANVVNSLSGKVAGLQVKRNNSLGGSTNVILRGNKSLTGNNQALFVVDGIPLDNSNSNTTDQLTGRGGYDYGNSAADINPDDVESITVLKGAAATALYGSRASNGVVMINTKKGNAKSKGIGVTINAGVNAGRVDKSTFASYQDKYGGGYGAYYEDPSGFFLSRDINNDGTLDLVDPLSEDASYGAAFDPNLQVYQWDAFDPTSPNFGKSRPWVNAANGPSSVFETAVGTNNSILIDGTSTNGYFKLGYTKATDKGILPNSRINKDLVNFGAGYDLTKKLQVFTSVNYTATDGLGRYGSGYDSKNLMGNFRQWWQVNNDLSELKAAYERTNKNITWNWADPTDLVPIYWDNPYWTRYENYENDHRNRYFGSAGVTYNLTSWFDVTGRVSIDQFDEIQEERTAVGSIDVSQYSRFNRTFREVNYDLLGQFKQFNLGERLQFDALVGANVRKTDNSSIRATTNGGLAIPRVYSLSNTQNALDAPVEVVNSLQVNGVFARAGFIYDKFLILDGSIRRDQASSLPTDNNAYFYPSGSLGFIFSQWLGDNKAVSFGKLRLNYAEVGNTAPPLSVSDVYDLNTPFSGAGSASVPLRKNNPDLKPERTKSLEAGLEMRFLNSNLGFDVTYYKTNTVDQIYPAAVSRATGYSSKFINAGNVENKGVEVSLFIRPVHSRDFDWTINANWARNRSLVKDLGGIKNLQLASFQGGVTVNASVGEPYGTIKGNNFVYLNGQKVVAATGYYQQSATSDEIIGNVNADWTGGVTNTLRYKNLSLGFLVDVQQGGDVFSLDLYYGLATGLYPETAGNNDKGNPLRSAIGDGGGVIVPGVLADGSTNAKRVSAVNFGLYGYRRNPAAAFVYDASYVKLREINLTFDFPSKWMADGKYVKGLSLGLYGRNLWIIHKNLPYADPEDGLSSGNVQGYQSGAYPTVRTVGVNLNLKF